MKVDLSHPSFPQPADINGSIWRYMDFTKFAWMCATKNLFFSRADRLGDTFEGSWTKGDIENRRRMLESLGPSGQSVTEGLSKMAKGLTIWSAVNCWHKNKHESAAMWKVYLRSGEGITIRSTYQKLCKSMSSDSFETIYVGEVKYLDYEQEVIATTSLNAFSPLMCKRKSFEWENEVRAVIVRLPMPSDGDSIFRKETIEEGIRVPVDMENLVESVYVVPGAPKWLFDLVRTTTEKFGLTIPVRQSNLDSEPIY